MVRSIGNVMKLAFKFAVKWGYLNENPMGEKRVELPRGSTKRQRQPVQLTAAGFFLLLSRLGPCEKVAVAFAGWLGPRIGDAKWQDLDLDLGVVSFRQICPGRITPLKTEASRTNFPGTGRDVGVAARVALRHHSRRIRRLGLCLALYEGQAAVLTGANDEEAHQAGRIGVCPPQHRLAQLPAHGERLGQGGGTRTGGGENSSAAREPRHHIRGLRRSWNGSQAEDSAAASELRQTAGHTRSVEACTHLVNLCDPYLTQIVFADLRQVQEKYGSSGRTRTYNPPVNSRADCVPPIDSKGTYNCPKASKPLCLVGLAESLADSFTSSLQGHLRIAVSTTNENKKRHPKRLFFNASRYSVFSRRIRMSSVVETGVELSCRD